VTVSLAQVRSYGGEYKARIGSGKLATTASCTMSARDAARVAFAKRLGLNPYKRETIIAITVSHVSTSAASGVELYRCELVSTPESEGN
jgi:hypothetical protein